jgi:transglutaminase-like putative cysteine protease
MAPNAWVQSTHPEIVSFARRAASKGTVARQMHHLIAAVRARMTGPVDFLGYASALEALRHRSGDCTEFAVLLTAAARARGIPTRIIIGLVYADRFSGKKDVFSPHAWVQAWDGERWTSYDAALDGFDATHIGIALGDGDPRQFEDTFAQLPSWRIEKAGAVRSSSR